MYKSQLFFKDVLWVVAVHTIKTSWKQKKQYLTTLLERIHGENPKKTKNLEKTNKKQYLETLWESSIDKIKKTSRKPKNQNFSENVWSEAHVWFFLVLPRFFWFFLVLTLKKLKKLKVFLVFWIK